MQSANALCADYLYQTDKFYDVTYDTGDRSIQCGRHNDVFKLWLMWRSKVILCEFYVSKRYTVLTYIYLNKVMQLSKVDNCNPIQEFANSKTKALHLAHNSIITVLYSHWFFFEYRVTMDLKTQSTKHFTCLGLYLILYN